MLKYTSFLTAFLLLFLLFGCTQKKIAKSSYKNMANELVYKDSKLHIYTQGEYYFSFRTERKPYLVDSRKDYGPNYLQFSKHMAIPCIVLLFDFNKNLIHLGSEASGNIRFLAPDQKVPKKMKRQLGLAIAKFFSYYESLDCIEINSYSVNYNDKIHYPSYIINEKNNNRDSFYFNINLFHFIAEHSRLPVGEGIKMSSFDKDNSAYNKKDFSLEITYTDGTKDTLVDKSIVAYMQAPVRNINFFDIRFTLAKKGRKIEKIQQTGDELTYSIIDKDANCFEMELLWSAKAERWSTNAAELHRAQVKDNEKQHLDTILISPNRQSIYTKVSTKSPLVFWHKSAHPIATAADLGKLNKKEKYKRKRYRRKCFLLRWFKKKR